VIIGGGPAGLTAAIALRRAGLEARVYERATERGEIGAGLTLWPNAMKALDTLGVGEAVRAAGLPCEGIALRTWRGQLLDRTGRDLMERRFGGTGTALHRAELLAALTEVLGEDIVQLGERLVAFRDSGDGVRVTFAGGREVEGDMLVGADGIRSTVRQQLLGPLPLRYAGFPVWRGLACFELTGDARVGTVSLGQGAQFGLFPMTGSRAYWFASAGAPEGTYSHSNGDGASWRRELLERFAGWHEPIEVVIRSTPETSIVVSDVHDLDPLRRWGFGRVTLVGDSAHPSTPNLGQGACQAIEDAVVLAACVGASPDIAGALRDYEQRRRRRANAMLVQSRRMARVGQWSSPLASRMRDHLIRRMPERARLRHLDWMFSFST
jgi:2-polyprenyl-6-methoxyphenol hydroxylase-like FAD-dependent oxidoreductase